MNHADWAKHEANTIELTKCGICGVHSYATIANGWDEVTDHETGETFEICGGCSNDFVDAPNCFWQPKKIAKSMPTKH